MPKFKITMLAAVMTLGLTLGGAVNKVEASGIPVFDGAEAANSIQDFVQMLTDYANQLEQAESLITQIENQITAYEKQVEQFNQQMIDTAKPITELWGEISSTYEKGMQVAQTAQGIYENASSAVAYLEENYGSAEFWEQCALTNCDPTGKLKSSYTATMDNFHNIIGQAKDVTDKLDKNEESIDKLVKQLGSDPGINASIQDAAKIQAIAAKNQIEVAKMQMKQMQAEAAKEAKKETDDKIVKAWATNFFKGDGFKGTVQSTYEWK